MPALTQVAGQENIHTCQTEGCLSLPLSSFQISSKPTKML